MEHLDARTANAEPPPLKPATPAEDWEAVGQLFSRHHKRLYQIAYHVLGCREDAEDAVQEGFLHAIRNLKSFEGRSQLSTWLTRIVINDSLASLRNRRKSRLISIDQEPPQPGRHMLASEIADKRPRPDESFTRQEDYEILEARISQLPVGLRRTCQLYYIKGSSLAETADGLGLSETTVKARLFRARMKIFKSSCTDRRTGSSLREGQTRTGLPEVRSTPFSGLQIQPSTS